MPYPDRLAARRRGAAPRAGRRRGASAPPRLLRLAVAAPLAALALAASAAEASTLPDPFEPTPAIRAAGRRLAARPGGVGERGDRIVQYIFDETDGLGFHYRPYPTLTAAEAFEKRAGNCLTLVNLFVALARAADLRAYPMEVEDFETFSRRGGAVLRSAHVIAALEVGGQIGRQVWTVDFLPDRPKSYRQAERLSDAQFKSRFYNSVAVEALLAGDLDEADRLFVAALELDPRAAETWSNWAVHAARSGDRRTAAERAETALELDPGHLPALANLASLHRRAGRTAEAEALETRALARRSQSPYFLVDLAVRELGRGRLDEAERLLRRARRIDETIPEIHLALARVDLRRGRTARAEEHFAAARRLAGEMPPSLRAGLDRKIDKLEKLAAAN